MSYPLSFQFQDDSVGTPAPPKNVLDSLLIKVGLKEQLYLSSAQVKELLLRENAWKLNAELSYKIILENKDDRYREDLLMAIDNIVTQAERYRIRRDKLWKWVRRRVERELLVTLQAMTSINEVGYCNISPSERAVWAKLIESSTWKMHCWLNRDMRMDGGLFLLPGKPEDALPLSVMPELFRDPVKPSIPAPQPDLKVMNDALIEWRRTVQKWEKAKIGIPISSSRTRGDYLIQQVEASIEAMASSPKLQQSQKARDRLQESMTQIQGVLLETLKESPADSEDAFVRHLDILDRQVL